MTLEDLALIVGALVWTGVGIALIVAILKGRIG